MKLGKTGGSVTRSLKPLDMKECEANRFACNLLMPPRMIRKLLEENPHITAAEMARIFEVPDDIMTAWLVKVRL